MMILLVLALVLMSAGLIVDRVRTRARQLQRERDSLQRLADTLPLYIARCSADNRFLFVNHRYAARFGLAPADVIGRQIADVMGQEAYETIRPRIEEVLGGTMVEWEDVIPYDRIGPRTMHVQYIPERDGTGALTSFLAVIADVTAQRTAEADALDAHERARLAADAAALGTWEWNVVSGTVTWSDRACEMFGLDPCTPISLDLFIACVHPDDRERVRNTIAQFTVPESEALINIEYRIHRMDDSSLRWIRTTGRRVAADPRRVVGSVQDVTAEHRAAEEREALLAREHDARREAEQASRLKDEFVATLSHELRTPLNAILGYANMLRSGSIPASRATQGLAIIERNARLLRQLVEDVLDISRVITGKLRLSPTILDPAGVVELALDSIRPAAEAKRLVLALIVRDDRLRVLADADRLQQIVWNLLSNAVKFTPPGGRISVELSVDEASEYAVITVADSGVGIPAEFLPHVFERFRQGSNAAGTEHGGLGLGLAIVRHLTEMQGGTITAESDGAGQGSTFTLRFPLRAMDAPAAWTAHGLHVLTEMTSLHETRLDGVRVLIIDDDPDSVALLEQTLGGCGARVRSAPSATDGLRELEREIPDVILSDIALPGMDGHEFIRTVRDRPAAEGGRVPAIALTAYGRDEDRRAALRAGFQLHLTKPCDPHALTRAIAAIAAQPS